MPVDVVSEGLFEAKPCSWNEDTKCCPHKDMLMVDGVCSNVTQELSTPTPSTSLRPFDTDEGEDGNSSSICDEDHLDLPVEPCAKNRSDKIDLDSNVTAIRRLSGEGRGKDAVYLIPVAFFTLTGLVLAMYGWMFLFETIRRRYF
ncbi:hypothetical protein ElyMa_004812000 [Elysia marginata]|uniref:Uncharacterized protein n=1 Tax=Elysia marginata TaxID=1093978 RepID=A0AAV4IEQ7_9GAST|nr:hypothetical protein ElyMa_004812000 [Elysia marginata]